MTRELKFRAWDIGNKCWVKSGYGGEFTIDSDGKTITIVIPTNHNDRHEQLRINKDVTLMQYTGLKDKNGVEIYEGDIVEYYNAHWNAGGMGRLKKEVIEDIRSIPTRQEDGQKIASYKVIGNIHENPELLTTH